jgi:alpha-glucosidase
LHTAFNFDFLICPWDEQRLRQSIEATLAVHARVGAPATWVLSNHDVTRVVTRYGRADTSFAFAAKRHRVQTDLVLGYRRARAAALLAAALPGSLYIYQGDELGLPEVEDIPAYQRTDPMHFRSGGIDPGRDGCRVPLPWSGGLPPYGFSTGEPAAASWLAQPSNWAGLTVKAQLADPASMLNLYRQMLTVRRAEPDLRDHSLHWLPAEPGVLAFARGRAFGCLVNLSGSPVQLPPHQRLLLASEPLTPDAQLAVDAAAWLRLGPDSSVPDAGNGG